MKEITVTAENFDAEVVNSSIPVLVDFWASWCGPCKLLSPIIDELAEEFDGIIKVGKINVDDEQELAVRFNVASIPTVMLFKNGTAEKALVGYRTAEQLKEELGL